MCVCCFLITYGLDTINRFSLIRAVEAVVCCPRADVGRFFGV